MGHIARRGGARITATLRHGTKRGVWM